MPEHNAPTEQDSTGAVEPAVADAVEATEAYETDEGVVFYDAENPLAWVQADHAVDLEAAL